MRYASDWEEAINQACFAQEVFAQNALSVPLFSVSGYKAMSRRYVGSEAPYTGNYWEGVVNIQGYGIDDYWSFLNMHPQGYELGDGSMTIRWGLSTWAISSFNPIYASTESGWKILDLIYEPLIRWNPYACELIPWLAEGFSVGMYNHPVYGECTRVQFTMRPDAYWSDGTPVTAYDVYFTLVKLDDILASRGLPPPWWKKNVCARAHVIGSGPWRFVEYIDCGHVFLVANKPGSTVQTNLPGSRLVTSPYGYFRYSPVCIDVHNILGKFLPGTYNFDVTITNLCQTSSMDVDVTIEVDKVILWLWTGSIPAGESSVLPVLYNFDLGMHMINVTVYCGLPNLGWTGIKIYTQLVYTTLKEDITGSTFYDDIGIPTYPYKSFLQTPDFKISLNDLFTVYHALDSYPGHPRWNPIADISCDCVINITDLNLIYSKLFPGQYNIAITNVATSKTIVCQGYSLNVNVTLENQSSYTENVTLELKFNEYKVKTSSISVNAGTMTTVTLAVIPRSFIFQMISREPGGAPPQGTGSFTINGNGTLLKAKTGSINWGNVSFRGGVIELYKSDGALIKRLELLIPPDGNGIVFTNATYRDGLYAVGTTVGSVCFLDDNGESGEMSIAETPINGIRIEGTNVTLYTACETILIRRINMEFALTKGQYTISAYARPVLGETYTADNTFVDGWVVVAMPGDINADGIVDIFDCVRIALAFSATPHDPNWDPNADIDNSNLIDIFDLVIIAIHFAETDP